MKNGYTYYLFMKWGNLPARTKFCTGTIFQQTELSFKMRSTATWQKFGWKKEGKAVKFHEF